VGYLKISAILCKEMFQEKKKADTTRDGIEVDEGAGHHGGEEVDI
jgi:hypothetical protein